MHGRLPSAFWRASRGALALVGREALRIVLPSWCVCCQRELAWDERTASCCADCWRSLPRIESARCVSCAQPAPVAGIERFRCGRCLTDPLPLGWCDAWGAYQGGLERLLHAFKFSRHDFLDEPLAGLLEEVVRRHDIRFDAVVAVPMHPRRERRRGYNQADLLARALSRRIGTPCTPALLRRRKDGATQSTLPKKERAANVRHAFEASLSASGRSVLLVDDVTTTGETLRACAEALRGVGAIEVCAAVVAKAV